MATTTMPMAATTEKAGWWTRFLAILIDFIALGIVTSILTSILYKGTDPTSNSGLSTLLGVIYYVYFWSSYGKGQTLGSRALKIRVVKTDGSYLDLVGAFLRYVGLVISCIVIFIGVIWAAFDANKQGWHDKIAGTYVVKA
jgi:uncharacterized RDD family membrane protein YckC